MLDIENKNILKEVGVLLIALLMILSTAVIVNASSIKNIEETESNDAEDDTPIKSIEGTESFFQMFNSRQLGTGIFKLGYYRIHDTLRACVSADGGISWLVPDSSSENPVVSGSTMNNIIFAEDLVLPSNSHCIDAGTDVGLTKDYAGTSVHQGSAQDIRAYGYQSNTYYVDATNGNDSNPGTSQRPLKTISKGVELAQPGDNIWIYSGTYREMITLIRSGTDSAHTISIRPVSGANVSIKGSDIVNGWEQHSGSIWKRTDWLINSQQVFIDGIPIQQIGETCPFNTLYWGTVPILPPVGTGLLDMTPGSFFYDLENEILYVKMSDSSHPNTHLIEASVRDFVISSYDTNFIELHNLSFSHSNVSSIPYLMGMVNIQGKSWLVESCTFTYGDLAGLSILGEGHRIINNVCNYNGSLGITFNGSDAAHNWEPYEGRPPQDIVLEGNETSFNNYRGFYIYFEAGGIKACNSCNGVKILCHTAKSNDGPGVWFDLYCQNITIDRCLLKNNTRGIEYEMCEKGVISNNLIIGNIDHGIYVSASDSVKVLNNTVNNNKYGIVVHGMPRTGHPSLKNNVIRNNIIGESSLAHLVVYSNSVTATGNTSDYNLFLPDDMGQIKISWTSIGGCDYEVNFTDLTSFSSATQQDANSIAQDPLFTDPANGNFTLQTSSPCIDAGIDVGLTHDYAGTPRPRGIEYDIGAFEYQGNDDYNLDCNGILSWPNVQPDSVVNGSFTVENVGNPGLDIDWCITEWPSWGTWTFTPISGDNLSPEDGPVTVDVSVVAPDEQNKGFTGCIKIVNKDNINDFCIMPVSLATPKNKQMISTLFIQFLERVLGAISNVRMATQAS